MQIKTAVGPVRTERRAPYVGPAPNANVSKMLSYNKTVLSLNSANKTAIVPLRPARRVPSVGSGTAPNANVSQMLS